MHYGILIVMLGILTPLLPSASASLSYFDPQLNFTPEQAMMMDSCPEPPKDAGYAKTWSCGT